MTREQVAVAVRAAFEEQRGWWLVPKERRCSLVRVLPDEQGKRVAREFGSAKEARAFLWDLVVDAAVAACEKDGLSPPFPSVRQGEPAPSSSRREGGAISAAGFTDIHQRSAVGSDS